LYVSYHSVSNITHCLSSVKVIPYCLVKNLNETHPVPKRSSGNPPGRPKAFCEKEALHAAVLVFADKGFEGASLSDLTEAMGINKFSLYATYGNKEALYVKAMTEFNAARYERVAQALDAPLARDGIRMLLTGVASRFTDPNGPGSCFVTQAPLAANEASQKTRRHVAEMRASVEKLIRERFERALTEGELPAGTSAADLARFFAVIIQGFALQAQHGGTREELLRVIDVAMAHWP
jgi:AcrR family transcriptional regulator